MSGTLVPLVADCDKAGRLGGGRDESLLEVDGRLYIADRGREGVYAGVDLPGPISVGPGVGLGLGPALRTSAIALIGVDMRFWSGSLPISKCDSVVDSDSGLDWR